MNVQRVFGCGIDGQVFKDKYKGLSDENRSRLIRVAGRVWLTQKLRYELALYSHPFAWQGEEYSLRHVEIPSMEVYLLCTCLDTLAGRAVYKNFKDWIKEQPDIENLGLKEITALYSQYEEAYGIGRNLRSLFRNLPKSAKDWLIENVVIRKAGQPIIVEHRNADMLLDRLYRYFYNVRRNAFTHNSASRPTPVADDVREPLEGGLWVTPVSGTHFRFREESKQKWNLPYRQGLDEATILRIIICAVALKLLNIELTPELIDANLQNYSRLHALYAFVSEVNWNSNVASLWSRIDDTDMTDYRLQFVYSEVPLLSTTASIVMNDRYLDNRLESAFRQMTSQYVRQVDHINSLVSEFNETHPPTRTGDGQQDRWNTVKDFLEKLRKTSSYNSIVKLPSKRAMTDLWRIIRDPCYTPKTI